MSSGPDKPKGETVMCKFKDRNGYMDGEYGHMEPRSASRVAEALGKGKVKLYVTCANRCEAVMSGALNDQEFMMRFNHELQDNDVSAILIEVWEPKDLFDYRLKMGEGVKSFSGDNYAACLQKGTLMTNGREDGIALKVQLTYHGQKQQKQQKYQ